MPERTYGDRPRSDFARSIDLQERARSALPESTSSNYRGASSYAPYPMIYVDEAEGATLTDVDGNEYLDLHGGVSAVILGHRPPEQIEAVRAQLDRGPYFATAHELEVETAEALNDLLPASDRVKFASTGTEAVMGALRLARAYTGKEKILTFEGMYHGHSDDALVNVHPAADDLGSRRNPTKIPEAPGVPAAKLDAVETVPWNDADLLEERLERDGDDVAAVITEAVMSNAGLLWPDEGYLDRVRELTREHDVLLILDEVVTGFRMGLRGAQARFDLEPDLAVYGKAMANGYPNAALTGRAEVMDHIGATDGATWMGTFSGNPLVVSATKGCLDRLRDLGEAGYEAFHARCDRLADGLREVLADAGHDVFVPEHAGFLCVHFTDGETDPTEWRDWRDVDRHGDDGTFAAFAAEMVGQGVYVPPAFGRINPTFAHTDEDVETALEAAKVAAGRVGE